MFGDLLQPTHLMILAIVLLVLFGGKKIPELGRGLGEGLRGFRDGLKGLTGGDAAPPAQTAQQAVAPAPPVAAPVEQPKA